MIGQLVVNGTNLDLTEGVPFPLNYSIADIKEPQKRNRNFSKEIVLPGTASNMNFFSSTYQLALSTVGNTTSIGFNYDPTIRISAKYYNGGLLIFNGLIRLNEVTLSDGDYTFKCTLFSNFIDLFMTLGDKKVSELGWSEYNHVLNRGNVTNSFATSVMLNGVNTSNMSGGNPLGWGYHYGMVDYGYTTYSTRSTTDIVPLIYCKEIIEKCLNLANLTFSSTFLNSTLFKKYLLGFEGGNKAMVSDAELLKRKVDFTGTYDQVITKQYDGVIEETIPTYQFSWNDTLNLIGANNVTTIVSDIYDQFEDGLITIEKKGIYNLAIVQTLYLADSYGAMTFVNGAFYTTVDIIKNGTVINTTVVNSDSEFIGINLNVSVELDLNIGDTIEVFLTLQGNANFQGTPEPYTVTISDNNDFHLLLTNKNGTLQDGDTVELSRFIPDMKASTFLEGMMLAHNLYISDPNLFGVVRIEPLADFYLGTDTFWDITDIVDWQRDIVIKPASTIEGKIYKFQWLKDEDYDNVQYRNYFNIDYGNHWYTVSSTFQTGDRLYQLPFAQAVPTDAIYPFVAPRIIQKDAQGIVKPFKGKPHLYLWNGLKTGAWRLTDTNPATYSDLTTYPSVHHFDNWESPTFDLNWGLPILFDYNAKSVTTDNLYSRYHERFVKEITGKDSKIVELYAKISNNDINKLNFAKLIMWNGVLYRLNLVSDFDPNVTNSTKIELIKILEAKTRRLGTKTIDGIVKPNGILGHIKPGEGAFATTTPILKGGIKDVLQYKPKIKGN